MNKKIKKKNYKQLYRPILGILLSEKRGDLFVVSTN